mmetsp:Transcript_36843/g.49824  ORF Transcript_36843/g.49824 Transcript_36843/m.49824 type:complete len:89 (+) Transcript_36843:56-322(+)|eukprot:CAMPEP_0185758210 /NCGR_PEP_ID=MMETSP1174-20130828/16793_1 /TAXON_ID=35687 /ORGANISM="Dictyocha speculum, Strain CCMP1381" /LENGTH=88 /DNA_ID=CAMNT_0028437951 /DNA_START=56 /DNA_END=322 /DNA_ORIENTATION=-
MQAQALLGYCYDTGEGVKVDKVAAFKWYEHAAEQGETQSECKVSLMYLNGVGVAKSASAASMWAKRAAAQGDGQAKRILESMGELPRS